MRVRSAPIVVFLRIRIVIFRSRLRLPPRVIFDVDDAIDVAADIVEQPNKYICILSRLSYSILSCNIRHIVIILMVLLVDGAKHFSFPAHPIPKRRLSRACLK